MRYFHKLAEGLVITPLLHAVQRNPKWWDEDTCRTTFDGTPHVEVNDIILRFGSNDVDEAGDDLEAVDREVMAKIPGAKNVALDLMRMVGGVRLGRMVITKLEPGKKILPHKDTIGKYASYYSRYHLVLQGLPGSLFRCGDETVNMRTGEIWWFDASVEHELMNNSPEDRIHALIDVRIDP